MQKFIGGRQISLPLASSENKALSWKVVLKLSQLQVTGPGIIPPALIISGLSGLAVFRLFLSRFRLSVHLQFDSGHETKSLPTSEPSRPLLRKQHSRS